MLAPLGDNRGLCLTPVAGLTPEQSLTGRPGRHSRSATKPESSPWWM